MKSYVDWQELGRHWEVIGWRTIRSAITKTQSKSNTALPQRLQSTHQWVSRVSRPRQHSICYLGDSFTSQKTQPTVSRYWRQTKINTINTHTQKITENSLVCNNTTGWLDGGSHRGQGHQAWTAMGLPPRYPQIHLWSPNDLGMTLRLTLTQSRPGNVD